MKRLSELTPEEKWIIVAEFDGWELRHRLFHNGEWKDVPTWVQSRFYQGKPETYCMAGQWIGALPPDYPNDLNAICKAIRRLPKDLQQLFAIKLKVVVGNRLISSYDESTYWIDADSHEFTDALILTIGKATL